MGKLTRQEAELHQEACALVELDRDLDEQEREFVLLNWQESAIVTHGLDAAYFTPPGLAGDLSLHVHGDRIIDLGAGIGRLAWGSRDEWSRLWTGQSPREFVCVEKNPLYVKVGRKVLPEATWICADVYEVPGMNLGRFSTAIANPPFGRRLERDGGGPRYRGPRSEYHFIDVAADLADNGAFIVPQDSAPFRYSGRHCFTEEKHPRYRRFERETGIRLEPNLGIDTSFYVDEWRGVRPVVEVVVADFTERFDPGL